MTQTFSDDKFFRYLFYLINQDLENINQWFISNKLSLNIKKTKYSFFHKPSQKENIPLLLLIINDHEIQQTKSIKFWGFY